MDDLGFNKIAGAVLAVALGMLVLTKLPGVVMGSEGEGIAYKVGAIDTGGSAEVEVDLPFPQADWVAAMDAAQGAKVFKKCKSCHNNEAGGPNGTGPGLHGVVGNDIGSHDGFSYSAALTGLEGNWTYEALDAYLEKPSKYAPGTKMLFVGLKKPTDRAAVIEYLRVADSSPSPRPEAMPAVAEGAEDDAPELEASAEDSGAAPDAATQEDAGAVTEAAEPEADEAAAASEDAATTAEEKIMDAKDTVMDDAAEKAMDAKDNVLDAATDAKDSVIDAKDKLMESAPEKPEMPAAPEMPEKPEADPTE